jgi:hypothetical protein
LGFQEYHFDPLNKKYSSKFSFFNKKPSRLSLDIQLQLSYNQVDIDKLQKEIKQSIHQTDTDA